jgi:hypothetical protein
MTAKYHNIITQITVKPENEPIMSEMATTISISDEAAGMFIEVSQNHLSEGTIRIDEEEWTAIRDGIDRMFLIIKDNDTNK